jgi:hypothetical protein
MLPASHRGLESGTEVVAVALRSATTGANGGDTA